MKEMLRQKRIVLFFLSYCKLLEDLGALETIGYEKRIYLDGTKITKSYIMKFKPQLLKNCVW